MLVRKYVQSMFALLSGKHIFIAEEKNRHPFLDRLIRNFKVS
jgi:hypothetical protein